MPRSSKIGALAVKLETIEGVVESITTAELMPFEKADVTRDTTMVPNGMLQNVVDDAPPKVGEELSSVSIDVRLRGSAAAGTEATHISAILQTMGLTHTNVTAERDEYVGQDTFSGIKSLTSKKFEDGKYTTARGVRGDGTINLEGGKHAMLSYKGKGIFYADGDVATPAPPSEARPIPPIVENLDSWLLKHLSTSGDDAIDGTLQKLREGAADNVELAYKITGDATVHNKIHSVWVRLKKAGTPATETNGVWIEIQGDSNGPDGSAISNGTSAHIHTAAISTTEAWYEFTFTKGSEPVSLDTVVNWVVVKGDYAESSSNCIEVRTLVCAVGNQRSMAKDSTYAALSLENVSVRVLGEITPYLEIGKAEIKFDNKMTYKDDLNFSSGKAAGYPGGRKLTLALDPYELLDSERNLSAYLDNATDLFWHCTVGDTPGNILTFTMAHLQRITRSQRGDKGGLVTHPLELQCLKGSDFLMVIK
jgi:hypothetical protein